MTSTVSIIGRLVLPFSQKQLQAKKKIKIPGFWIVSLLNYEAKAKENLWDFNLFRKCGLLLWRVRAQHVNYESECERKCGGIDLPFHCESENEIKSPGFHL